MAGETLVYAFSHEIAQPQQAANSDDNKWVILTIQAGNYFEDRVYAELNKLNGSNELSAQKQHVNARNIFAAGGATGRFFTLYDGGVRYIFQAEEIYSLGKAIETAAQSTAKNFYETVKKKAEGKNVTFELTSGGNEIGDIVASILEEGVAGEHIILETKYQLSSSARVRWFELVSSTLFGEGEYESFLEQHKNEYWSYKYAPQSWTLKIRAESVKAFLEQVAGGEQGIWSYLLQKGKVGAGGTKEIGWARTTVSGQTASVTMKLSDLMDMTQVRLKSATSGSSTMVFEDQSTKSEVGTFGMTKYSKPENKEEGPMGASFTFAMYLSQKVFNSQI